MVRSEPGPDVVRRPRSSSGSGSGRSRSSSSSSKSSKSAGKPTKTSSSGGTNPNEESKKSENRAKSHHTSSSSSGRRRHPEDADVQDYGDTASASAIDGSAVDEGKKLSKPRSRKSRHSGSAGIVEIAPSPTSSDDFSPAISPSTNHWRVHGAVEVAVNLHSAVRSGDNSMQLDPVATAATNDIPSNPAGDLAADDRSTSGVLSNSDANLRGRHGLQSADLAAPSSVDANDAMAHTSPSPQRAPPTSLTIFVGIADFATLACPRAVRLAIDPRKTLTDVLRAVANKPSVGMEMKSEAELLRTFSFFRTIADGGDKIQDVTSPVSDLDGILDGSRLIMCDTRQSDARPTNEEALFPKALEMPPSPSPTRARFKPDGSGEQGAGAMPAFNSSSFGARFRGKGSEKAARRMSMGPLSVAKPLLEGQLYVSNVKKRTKLVKRWVVLDGSRLYVFKSATNAASPKFEFELQTISPKSHNLGGDGGKNVVRVFTPKGEFDFWSENAAELAQWHRAIENAHFNLINETVGSTASKRDVLGNGDALGESSDSVEVPGQADGSKVVSMFSAPVRRVHGIAELRAQDGNNICADCKAPDTTWVSTNLGVFLCIACCGAHRSLGTHVSKMRSVEMDHFDQDMLDIIRARGNDVANREFLAEVPSFVRQPTSSTSAEERIEFARAKWEDGWFRTRRPAKS